MRFEPSSASDIRLDIESIKPEIRQKLQRKGSLTEKHFISLISSPPSDTLDPEHPNKNDFIERDTLEEWRVGAEAVKNGEVAYVVLAGGHGIREGEPGAFMRLPKLGMTLMANKLFTSSAVTPDGKRVQPELWYMTSTDMLERMANHLCGLSFSGVVFDQYEAYRLNAIDRIEFKEPGVPYTSPTGTGDVGPALVESGLFGEFPKVKHCVITNCDNVLASLDLEILSRHIVNGNQVTCEAVERRQNERGGVVVWADNRLQIVESFRLPIDGFEDAEYLNTNSMIINVDALKADVQWRWHRVRRRIENKIVVQYERFIQQYTEQFKAEFILVDRDKRYLPVKAEADLAGADEVLNVNKRW